MGSGDARNLFGHRAAAATFNLTMSRKVKAAFQAVPHTGTSSSASQIHTDTVRSDRDKRQLRLEQEEQGPLKKGTCLPERQHAKFCIGIGHGSRGRKF